MMTYAEVREMYKAESVDVSSSPLIAITEREIANAEKINKVITWFRIFGVYRNLRKCLFKGKCRTAATD